MSEFGFAWQDPAWLLLAVPATLLAALRLRWRAALPLAAPPAAPTEPAQVAARTVAWPRSWRQRLVWLPNLLTFAALLLAVAAVARPVQRLPLPPERQGADLIVCLDTSSSMAIADLGPGATGAELDRFTAAREFATAFGRDNRHDRVGAVVFARYADLVCPPTLDRAVFAELLGRTQLVTPDGPEDATGFGAAVARAAEALARSSAATRAVILLSDGDENVASVAAPQEIAPLHAGQWCQRLGVRVYTVAVGKGRPAPGGGQTPLDTTALRELAAASGGKHFVAADRAALAAVQQAIANHAKSAFAEPRVLVREWFDALLWGALVAVGLAVLLRSLGLEVRT